MSMQSNEVNNFLNQLENEKGGKITWKTVTLFYGDSEGTIRQHGVFMYRVGNTFWFQDFKNERTILGLKIGRLNNESEYVKFESSFDRDEIEAVRDIALSNAKKICMKNKTADSVKTISKFGKIFREYVTEIKLKNGKTLYFNFLKNTFENEFKR